MGVRVLKKGNMRNGNPLDDFKTLVGPPYPENIINNLAIKDGSRKRKSLSDPDGFNDIF